MGSTAGKNEILANQGGCTKPSRWFSWNEAAADNLSEFAASRMVLEWYLGLGTDQSPDDIDQPQLCFKEAAGLKLCYLGHSWVTWENAHVISRLQEPCWDYFSRQLHEIKTVPRLLDGDSVHEHWLESALELDSNC